MKRKLMMIFVLIAVSQAGWTQSPKLKKVFNGKNLKGWVVPENNIWWKAEKGVLSVKNGPDKKGSILWTEKSYRDFVFQSDFKFGEGNVDSGIFLRTEKQQIQLGVSGSLKRDMTCSPYIPGKGYPVEASNIANLLKQTDWNTIKIEAKGKVYTVWLNGEQVLTYNAEGAIEEGPVGLQLHGNREMAIDFKNIRIGEI